MLKEDCEQVRFQFVVNYSVEWRFKRRRRKRDLERERDRDKLRERERERRTKCVRQVVK
jgi:hypothetical protein